MVGKLSASQVAGKQVCHFGAKTAREVCATQFSQDRANAWCKKAQCLGGVIMTPLKGLGGDSGGAVYVYNADKTGVYAVGLAMSATSSRTCDRYGCPYLTQVVTIDTVTSRLGATLVTKTT